MGVLKVCGNLCKSEAVPGKVWDGTGAKFSQRHQFLFDIINAGGVL